MSTTIDQRVVEMRFDNQNFERNVRTSMSTLEKLKQKLHLKGASKGLEEINTEAKKCNLSPLSTAVEGVRIKFSAMEVMAVTALSNITNSAVNAGKRMIKALTIDPITSGFNEYETQINAVQTILANTKSKGSTLEDVNRALRELNTYADKTIYNFTEMTRNIGTFTAAGIELDTSISAIQGIANLAAVSGSTSQQASTAMYQLSQALASGTVKLMDWNSVVNAGMGGEIFQEALKKTSEELQTGAAAAIEAEGSFRESLRTGWLTSEVLTETLKKFTTSGANEYVAEYTGLSKEAVETALEDAKAKYGEADAIAYASKALAEKSGKNEDEIKSVLDMAATAEDAATKVKTFSQLWDTMKEAVQSGWTQTWELIIGDFEQAKELLTSISDFFGKIIEKTSNARNDILKGALGRTFSDLKEKINGALAPAKKAVDTVNKVKDSVSDLGDVVNDVILGKFGNGQERIDKLTESGRNYYRVQNKVNETLGNAFRYTNEQIAAQDKLLESQGKVVDSTAEETAETENLAETQKERIKHYASLVKAGEKNVDLEEDQIEALKELGKTADKLGMPLDEFIDKMDEINGRWLLIDSFKSIGKGLIEVFNAIGQAWKNVFPSTIDDKADTLFNIIAAFHRFSRGVLTAATENADEFRRTFEGLFAILDLVQMVAGGALGFAFKVLNAILSSLNFNILDVTAGVGDAIVAFRDWVREHDFVTKSIEKVASFLVKAFVAVRDFIKMVLEIPEVQNAITNFKNACSNAFSNVGNFFSEGGKRIKEFIDRVKSMDSLTLDDLGKIFEDFRTNVLGYFFNFDEMFEGAKNVLSQFRDKVSECFSSIGDKFGWAKDKLAGLIDFIKSNIPSIIAMVMGFGLIKALTKIGKALEIISKPLNGLSNILENAGKVLKKFAGYISAKAWETRANAVLKLAIALGVLTACIVALTLVNKDRLWEAVGALAALMGVLTVFTLLITLIGKLGAADPASVGKGLNTAAISMLGMAISLSILVDSLKKMESLDTDKIGTSLVTLAGMAVGLVALSIALSRLGGKASLASAVTMIAMVLALKMMIGVLNDLGNLNLGKSLATLGLLFGIVAAFKLVLGSCNGVKPGAAITLIGIVLALKMTIGAIEALGQMNTRTITKGLMAIIPILAMFSLVMAASKLAGQNAAKAGVGILAMSVAIVVLIHAMKQLAGINQSDLEKGLTTVAVLLTLFSAIVAVSYFAGENAAKAGAMLLMMSGAILILTGVIWALQAVPSEGLNRALGAITVIGVIFGVLIAVSKLAIGSKGMIIALTIAVTALAAIVMALSILDPSALTRATIALDSIIAVFALLVFALSAIQKSNAGAAIGSVLALTLVAIALTALLAALTFLPNTGALIPAAASLSILLIAFSTALLVLSKAGQLAQGVIGSAYALSGVVAILALILGGMSFLPNPQPLILIASSLSILLLAFSTSLVILSKAGMIATSTISSTYALTGVVAILGAILSAMSFLPDPSSLLPISSSLSVLLLSFSAAMLILSKAGTIAPSTIGAAYAMSGVLAIIGAILSAMSFLPNPEALIPIAISLSIMMGALSLVCVVLTKAGINVAGAANAALGFAAFVGILAALLAALGGLAQIPGFSWLVGEGGELLCKIGYILGDFVGSILSGIGAGLTSGLPDMAADISAFGEGIKPFIDSMKGVSPELVDSVKNLAAAIAVIVGANFLDTITSFITGGKSLGDFATNISDLGKGLKGFADEIKGIDPETVSAGGEAVKALAEAAASIPNEGGMVSWFTGDNNLGKFIETLPDVGVNLTAFSNSLTGFNALAADSGIKALTNIALAAQEIPNEGGVASWFAGENNIGDFVSNLPSVGANLTAFSNSLTGFNALAADSGIKALTDIALAAHDIPNEGGVASWFAGENNIGDFVSKLPSVGANLASFSTSLTGFNALAADSGIKALTDIALAAHDIPNEGGVASWFAGENNIGDFVSKLPSVGANLASFSTSLTGFNALAADSGIKALKSIITAANEIPNEGGLANLFSGKNDIAIFVSKLSEVGAGLSTFSTSLTGFNSQMVSSAITTVSGIYTNLGNLTVGPGLSALFNVDSGIQNYVGYLPNIGSSLSSFTKNLSGTNSYTIECGIKAIGNIASLTNDLPKNFDALSALGDKLTGFGNNLKTYFSTMSGISEEAITNATAAITSINKLSTNVSVEKATAAVNAIDELIKMVNNTSSIKADATSGFTTSINNLAKVSVDKIISTFDSASTKMTDAGKTLITNVIKGAKSVVNDIGVIGQSITAKIVSGINAKKGECTKVGKTLIEQMVNSIKSQTSKFKNVAITAMKNFIVGITSKQSEIKTVVKSIISSCITTAKNEAKNTASAGKNFVTGFANGISENTFKAKAQAVAMAEAALKAAEEALGIKSPSKETYRIGGFFGKGFVNAVEEYGSKSYHAAYGMADYARAGLSGAIAKINDAMNNDIDAQPTIRPVVDLTNVESGANAINSMLNRRPSVGVMSEVRSIGSMMTWQSQNGNNDDIVSAIRDLSDKLSGSSGDSYSINGITYDDGTNVSNAVKTLVRAARVGRRR